MKTVIVATLLASTSAFAAELDLKSSSVSWEAKKVVAGGHHGTVPVKSAEIKEEEGKLKGGKIVLDLSAADVTDLEGEWKEKFLGHVKSADFFDVQKYPEAILNISSIEKDQAIGTLTIKDKTQPVKITFKQQGKELTGEVVFDRTKYGIVYGSNSFFKNLGDKAIAHDVKVGFKLVLK